MQSDDVKSKWFAVAIDATANYNISKEDKSKIKKIFDVYYFDATKATVICDQVRRYFLKPLYTTIETGSNVSDEDRAQLDEDYCYEPVEETYMSVSDVNALPEDQKVAFGEFPDHIDRNDPKEEEDFVRETWQGNCPF